uniref:VWFA domain-containing protein n=1 Tax=Plectus sambesii TaxID=2011161 RepID=A0A914VRN3_9BILA
MSTLQWDIVLLFDVSATALANNKMLLNLFKNASLAFSGNFIIGGNGAQVALAEYADAAYVITDFETITSQSMLNGAINSAVGTGAVPETPDIQLGYALQKINDYLITYPNSGLRKGVRHMVIFSAEVQPSDINSAIGLARQLHNQCVYTIGLAASGVDLSNIVGGTDFTSSLNSQADVTTVVNWLNQKACTLPACPPTN